MRFLADQNFPLASVALLRALGHDVIAVAEEMPGASDDDVLARAVDEYLILLTFDRDFGELIFRYGAPSPAGVVYFRQDPITPTWPGTMLDSLITAFSDDEMELERWFFVVAPEPQGIRRAILPGREE